MTVSLYITVLMVELVPLLFLSFYYCFLFLCFSKYYAFQNGKNSLRVLKTIQTMCIYLYIVGLKSYFLLTQSLWNLICNEDFAKYNMFITKCRLKLNDSSNLLNDFVALIINIRTNLINCTILLFWIDTFLTHCSFVRIY